MTSSDPLDDPGRHRHAGQAEQRRAPPTRAAMLIRLVGMQLAAAMVVLGVPALAPALRAELGLSRAATGLLVTAVFLGVVMGSWPAGRAVHAAGVRRAMLVASLGLGAGFAALSLAASYAAILGVLFVVGIFYSPVTPATNTGVVAWASTGWRTRAMAIKQMGVTAGASISAAVIPALTLAFGWRTAVVVVGLFVAVAGAVAARAFAEPSEPAPLTARPAEAGRKVVVLGLGTLLLLFVQHCVSTHYILALQDRGVALVVAGAALSILQAAATAARFGWAWLSDALLCGDAARGLLLLSGASAAVLAGMTLLDGARWPLAAAVLLGVTTQAGNGLIQLVLADAGGPSPATSSGIGMAIGFSGTVIGPPLFGLVADLLTYRSSWILLAVVALATGAVVAIGAPRARHAALG